MAIDPETSDSARLFDHLARALHERRVGRFGSLRWSREGADMKVARPPLELLFDYFRGDPPLHGVHREYKPYIRRFIRMGRLNIAGLVISSTGNRMSLRGFHTAEDDDETGDKQVRDLMQATSLQLVSRDAHDLMLAMADGYVICTPGSGGQQWPSASAEDPRQVIVGYDPVTGAPRGGLKLFRDDWDESDVAYLYGSDGAVQRFRREQKRSIIQDGPFRLDAQNWELDGPEQHTPQGRFPVVRLRNRHGVGEFEEHLDALDRINDKIFNEWWISKIQAFRQRAVKDLPDKNAKGEDIDYTDLFTASPDEMWRVPGNVEFWESQPIDLTPITASIKHDLERLAAALSQPLHTITPDAANGSAEGASLMREEHVYKVEDRRDRVTPAWAEVASLLMEFRGTPRDRISIVPDWNPVERYSLQEWSNAASVLRNVMPSEWIWRFIAQVDPAEIPNLRTEMGRQMLLEAIQGAAPATSTPPTSMGGAPPAVPSTPPGEPTA